MPTVRRKKEQQFRRIEEDRKRHREKVLEALRREDLRRIVAREDVITGSPEKRIKVKIESLKEYQFAYGTRNPMVGQHPDAKKGDKVKDIGADIAQGMYGQGAGDFPGQDVYETEVTIKELRELIRRDLELPSLKRRGKEESEQRRKRRVRGHRKKGPLALLDRRKTATERLKDFLSSKKGELDPESLEEAQKEFPFKDEHFRFKKRVEERFPEINAVVFCIMDTSGSMGDEKLYICRSIFMYFVDFLKIKYGTAIEIVFISHDSLAKEVTEKLFFKKGGSGGTLISSGYETALDKIKQKFDPGVWNIYIMHCSDGENLPGDNPKATSLAKELCEVSNLFAYFQVKSAGGEMIRLLDSLSKEFANIKTFDIRDASQIKEMFEELLRAD